MAMLKLRPYRFEPGRGVRIISAFLLIATLFSATLNNEALYEAFGNFWRKLFGAASNASLQNSAALHSSIIRQVTNTHRDAPAILTYGALYVSICFILLLLLLPVASQRKVAMLFYVGLILIFIVLLIIGNLCSTVLLQLSSQLIHFIVSPLPIIVLVPLLRWYLPHENTA
jgi:hypothetical protein